MKANVSEYLNITLRQSWIFSAVSPLYKTIIELPKDVDGISNEAPSWEPSLATVFNAVLHVNG